MSSVTCGVALKSRNISRDGIESEVVPFESAQQGE